MFDFTKENKAISKEQVKTMVAKQQLYHRVFDGSDGEAVIADLKSRSFFKVSTYDPIPVKMGINEGRRSLVNYMINLITKDIKELVEDLTK